MARMGKKFGRKNLIPFEKELAELKKKSAWALEIGGSQKVKRQRDRGKFTARESDQRT